MSESIKVLVIDDSEDDRMLYRRALNKSTDTSYTIIEADDGDEGLRLIEEAQPACILLDYSMPGRDGVEVLKRIRIKHLFVPVVMLTGQGNERVAVTAIQEGAQNYIAKSTITPEALQRVIRVAIEHCALQKRIYEQRTSLEIFTRALAHDLKEPIRTIHSFLDVIASHETMSERGKGYFNYIQKAAERMSALIDTVYFYTRLDGSEKEISKEECDLANILQEVKENLSELIRTRNAQITSDSLPCIYANRMQMIQLLQNLISNAILHCEATPAVHLEAQEEGEDWLLRVSDNGPGISEEHRLKIFEPFKRLVHHKEHGLGLGLAICKKIVELHGGKIWYEARPEGGAAFLMTLPKALPITATAEQPASEMKERQGNGQANGQKLASILLVEDNEADVELTRIMLLEEARLKCNLVVAHDGHEALARLQDEKNENGPIDLMLLDINMPGMDGFELLEQMRTKAELQRIPVVMCTTSTYDKDLKRAEALGVAGYLTKPAELGKLKSVIDKTQGVQLCQEGDGFMLLRGAA